MKGLVQYITEHLINEGGNAVECERIPAEIAMKLYKDIETLIKTNYRGVDTRVLGSVGKKKAGDTNGDIDIAINMKTREEVLDMVQTLFPDCEYALMPGIVSIGYKYEYKGRPMIGQVDFMVQDDLDWAEFFYSSPNYINDESQFKASVRNHFLSIVVSCVPTEEEPTMDGDNFVTKWKHTLSANGLSKQFLDYRGKKGLLKNPKKIKELEKFITKNKDVLAEFLFKKPNLKDFNSIESLWRAVHSTNFKYPHICSLIDERFKDEVLVPMNYGYEEFLNIVK